MTTTARHSLPFQVTALAPAGNRIVISRHQTRAAAERAARRGTADFRVEEAVPPKGPAGERGQVGWMGGEGP